jgi:tetratricopeptide (TPR) repeat protein
LSGLATVAVYQEDFPAARRFNEEVLEVYRSRADVRGEAVTLHNLGFVALCQDRHPEAVKCFEQAFARLSDVGDLHHMALTMTDLATATARSGDAALAASRLQIALNLVPEAGPSRAGAYFLDCGAELALRRGRSSAAVRWQAVADRVRSDLGVSLSPVEARQRESVVRAMRETLSTAEYAAAEGEAARADFSDILDEVTGWLVTLDTEREEPER